MTSFSPPYFDVALPDIALLSTHCHIPLPNYTFDIHNVQIQSIPRMSDYLQKLPMELQLAILCYLPDLPCLYRLSCVSRSMNAVFESRPIEILEAIMGDLTGDLRYLLRANAVALSSTLINIAPLDPHFDHDSHKGERTYFSLKLQDCVNPLPPTIPLASIQQLVLLSCRIEELAVSFFNTYLTRFNRLEFEPRPEPSQKDPPPHGEKASFTPRAIASIGWCEYYRVVCSLWQIQLSFSTCDLSKMRSRWSKMVAEADRLIRYTQLTDKRTRREQDTIACVKEFLEEQERTLMNTSLEHLQRESDTFITPPESQFMLPLIASPSQHPRLQLQDRDRGPPAQYGSSAFRWFSNNSAYYPRELFESKDWHHFRRLGFGIWDRERMRCMGLISKDNIEAGPHWDAEKSSAKFGRKMTSEEQALTWKSIKLDGRYAFPRPENKIS